MFLSLYVAMISGSFHLISAVLQWRACFEMPEMFSSFLVEVTSLECWLIRVLKLTLVWPIYFARGSQLQESK